MDICQCFVNLGGDMRNVAHLAGSNAVSWPEVCVIRHVHGDENVKDIVVVADEPRDMRAEVEHLRDKYGADIVSQLWPGMDPRLPPKAPDWVNRNDAPVEAVEAVEMRRPAAPEPKKRRRRDEPPAPKTIVDPHEIDAAL